MRKVTVKLTVCEEKDRELAAAKAECAGKDRELEDATAQIAKLTTDCESRLEEVKVRFELDKLRAIEQLRNEHVLELKSERQQQREEQVRADSWIADLKAHFSVELQCPEIRGHGASFCPYTII